MTMLNAKLNITDTEINATVQQAKVEAKEAANNLGMVLEEKDELPEHEDDDDEHEEDDDDEADELSHDENPEEPEASDVMQTITDSDNLTKDVIELEKVGMVDTEFVNSVKIKQESSLKHMHSHTIPMFEPTETSNDKIQDKYSPFVEVKHNGKVVYVRKTTLVWIFQQAECVSTDHLYRVRYKQPYSTTLGQESKAENSNSCHGDNGSHDIPQICKRIEIGDICAFKSLKITHGWRLGKVLQFAYLHGKSNKM